MNHENRSRGVWLGSGKGLILILLLASLVFLLLTGHSTQVITIVPYLLLLACPLLHMFMRRKHGKHDGSNTDKSFHRSKGGMSCQ